MLVSPDIVDHVRLMYEISWGPVLAVFSEVMTLLPFESNGYCKDAFSVCLSFCSFCSIFIVGTAYAISCDSS